MEFIREPAFDQEQYQSCLRRLHYDDRDVVMYENMLGFLWSYIIKPTGLSDLEGLLEEYTHWNLQMIDKCYYHLPHDLPYANVRRAYQSVIHLLDGDMDAGIRQLELIGKAAFMQDGRPDRVHMTKQGKVFKPMSRLFLIYNYEKLLSRQSSKKADEFRESYAYAFRYFNDGRHDEHDRFLKNQMEEHKDVLFYPEFDRIYRVQGGAGEFFLYYDEEMGIPLSRVPYI